MKRILIEDINDPRLSVFYNTNEKQLLNINHPKPGVFVAESELVINRALDAGYVPQEYLIIEKTFDNYQTLFNRYQDVTVYEVKESIFNQLKGFILIKGILAIFQRKEELTLEEVCKGAKRIVVMEEVVNPTNVGAIFRNVAGLFGEGVLLTSDACDPLYRRSIRVSMGNVFKVKYAKVNKDDYLDRLKALGFKTVALALRDDARNIDDKAINSEEKLAIILGSEGYGLSSKTIEESDYVVKIKMNDEVDSLNVASASGIALWQLCKKDD